MALNADQEEPIPVNAPENYEVSLENYEKVNVPENYEVNDEPDNDEPENYEVQVVNDDPEVEVEDVEEGEEETYEQFAGARNEDDRSSVDDEEDPHPHHHHHDAGHELERPLLPQDIDILPRVLDDHQRSEDQYEKRSPVSNEHMSARHEHMIVDHSVPKDELRSHNDNFGDVEYNLNNDDVDDTMKAAIFGVADGLVSSIGIVFGVYAAHPDKTFETVLAAGVAGMFAGACSMAAGEWITISAQAKALKKEMQVDVDALNRVPQNEREAMVDILRIHGIAADTARQVVDDLDQNNQDDDFDAVADIQMYSEAPTSPVRAMMFSFVAFCLGAIFPVIPWAAGLCCSPGFSWTVAISVICSLVVGAISSRFTDMNTWYSAFRQLFISIITAAIAGSMGTLIQVTE